MINATMAQYGRGHAYAEDSNRDIDNETIYYEAAEYFEEIQHMKSSQEQNGIIIKHKTAHEQIDNLNFCSGALTNFSSKNTCSSRTVVVVNESESECEKVEIAKAAYGHYNVNSIASISKTLQLEDVSSSATDVKNHQQKISEMKFTFREEEITMTYLKNHLRTIPVKCKQTSNKNRHLRTLLEIQNFYVDSKEIWVIKFSADGKYLATGGKKGILQIFEISAYDIIDNNYKHPNIISYLNFIKESPFRTYNDHSKDITDISWSHKDYNLLLTASIDHYVMLWDINSEIPVYRYEHDDMVSCVSFSPVDNDGQVMFVSGCLDKYVRIWRGKNQQPGYFNIKDKITAISFFPSGESIAVGTHNGKVCIYDLKPKLRYNCSFTCKNRLGKFSNGRKVTGIEFSNRTSAFITTGDSRIRLVGIPEGKLIHKYKGHKNEDSMIRAHNEETYDLLISASEDGYCYLWNKYNKENQEKKNYSYEYFKPFGKEVTLCSIFSSDICTAMYLKKLFTLTANISVISIIINATECGRLQVLLNCDEISNA